MSRVFDLYPRLRDVHIQPMVYQGVRGVVLRDPLGFSPQPLFVPGELASALLFMDGRHTVDQIRHLLLLRFGLQVPPGALRRLVQTLDRAFLLDNGRFRNAYREALEQFRRAPHRPLTLAGQVYPPDAETLARTFDDYGQQARPWPAPRAATLAGVVTPHIDYQRGGPVYAATWLPLEPLLEGIEQVLVLGTDHYGPAGTITLTRQHYATPYGVLPTDREAVEHLARLWGEEEAFAHELTHKGEHSIELALVWAHHARKGRPFRVLPVLVGSFIPYLESGRVPWEDERLETFIAGLAEWVRRAPTLVVAAVDLAHVGPAFGDPYPWDLERRARLRRADERLLQAVRTGDARAWFQAIAEEQDRYRICGFAPTYVYLRLLEGRPADVTQYRHCPADEGFTSLVSIAGAWTWADPA